MNKTIINGIDVSECEYFKINRGFNCYKGHNCTDKECSDCYFKQLKRLEQEIEAYQLSENEAKEIIAELEHENKELKEKIDIYENSIIANHDRAVGKRLMEVLQALEEIREIVLNFASTPIGFKVLNIPLNEEDLKTSEGKIFDFYTKLKNKINEVLNER